MGDDSRPGLLLHLRRARHKTRKGETSVVSRVRKQVGRFGRMYAWANRILRVDLSSMQVEVQPTAPYVPQYLGARGIAARLCWEEYPDPVGPFAPANPLMVFPGALTGSRAPYSGRTVVCAFSPQGDPRPWFTRSTVGGYFGGALKRAGYDGIVVTGASDRPVRIHIRDDEVRILPAGNLWGQDTAKTLQAIASGEGRGVRALVIGPAGERLSRIATIHAAVASACGQGGLGAVMGSKQLKAISVTGSGRVSLARPKTVRSIAKTLARMYAEDGLTGPLNFYGDIEQYNRELAAAGDGSARCHACTEGCITPCAAYMQDVPGAVHDRTWSGDWVCVGTRFEGFPAEDPSPLRAVYDWQLPRRAAFEMSVLSNRHGLNQADLIGGMVPWLIACQKAGLISELNGDPIDWSSPAFWDHFLHAIAYREGLGDILAEGGWAAAKQLGSGDDLARQRYPGWGYGAHCDGREGGRLVYPYWIVSALQWLADTRDPYDSGHGYLWAASAADRAAGLDDASARAALLDQVRAIGEWVYGSADAVDPYSGYAGKACPGYYQTVRAAIKDCLPVDAHFPLIYREKAPDRYWRLSDVEGIGELEGPAIEYHLFAAGTGVDWSEEEFELAAARVCTLERALQVRHWGRDRQMDESVLPYFEQVELYQSAFHETRHALDRERFAPVIDAFYALHGWDRERGWPTHARLEELGMPDVYAPMLQGAAQAQVARGQRRKGPGHLADREHAHEAGRVK
jgi:aldehyde:ferredoxin oxidoreductase